MNVNALSPILQNYPWLLYLIITWSLAWKALALWHSARNNQLVWYIALLVVNTVGLLEIIYLLFFRKKKSGKYLF
jgi:hypothetical protein